MLPVLLQGVRSLQFQHGLLSIGTGRGHVFFYDVSYLTVQTTDSCCAVTLLHTPSCVQSHAHQQSALPYGAVHSGQPL